MMHTGLLLVVASAVVGGEPHCPAKIDLHSCAAAFEGGALAVAMSPQVKNEAKSTLAERPINDILCRPDAHAHLASCHSTCALRLTVTDPHIRFTACVQDNVLTPYVPEGHIDKTHPLRKRVLSISYVSGGGCDPAAYGAVHAGTIVLSRGHEGQCASEVRVANAAKAGAAVFVNGDHRNSMDDLAKVDGKSYGAGNVVVVTLGSHFMELLMEEVATGHLPDGFLDLDCDAEAAVETPTLPASDDCSDLSMVGLCSGEPNITNRICRRCPQQLAWRGQKVCLWGNSLRPQDGRNHLRDVLALPADVRAVFISASERVGCTEADYRDVRGAVVFVEEETSVLGGGPVCTPWLAARHAEAAGALAFVSVVRKESSSHGVSGPARFVGIPVHSTLPSDYGAVRAMFLEGVRRSSHVAGHTVYTLTEAQIVDEGEEDHYHPVAEAVVLQVAHAVLDTQTFEFTPPVIVSLVAIVVLGVMIALKLRKQLMQVLTLPAKAEKTPFAVPLSVASMGLSISLVLIVAAVAFALAHTAGQKATDKALESEREALMQTYRISLLNTETQALQVTKQLTAHVVVEMQMYAEAGEQALKTVAKLYRDTDASWGSWNSRYQAFVDACLGYCCKDSLDYTTWQKAPGGWTVAMLSTAGYYADHKTKTDDRADAVRGDGLAHVSVTQQASLYGLATNLPVGPDGSSVPVGASFAAGATDTPATRLGMWPGDRHAAVVGRDGGHSTWTVHHDSLPWNNLDLYHHPLSSVSILGPVYSRGGQYLGVVEAMMDTAVFRATLQETISADPAFDNVTIVVYERTTSDLLIDTNDYQTRVPDLFYAAGGYAPHHQLIGLQESLALENNALHHYMEAHRDFAHSHAGEFDQAEHYTGGYYYVFDLHASALEIRDVSGNLYGVETRGSTCGTCTAARRLWDGRTGDVMMFDGANSLLIYQNLTTDVPHVARTRRGTGAWASTVPFYNLALPLAGVGGGTNQECVASADPMSPSSPARCMLRANYFGKPYSLFARFKPSADVPEEDRSQEIFTESAVGETNVRMYANGAVALNTLAYGCATKPVTGGTRGGEWTSVTFVRSAKRCTSYVNGKLWDSSLIAPDLVASPHGTPFEVGRGFVGEVDALVMLNVTVTAAEAVGMHATGHHERQVPSRRWLLQLGRMQKEDVRHTGMDWVVATMIPRDDVMRVVDETNEVTLANVHVQKENTDRDMRQRVAETVFVIVAIAFGSVFVFLVFNDMLTKPFSHVCFAMADAAVMRIDTIPDTTSRIVEINVLNRSMKTMLENLKEYKAYMPQSVLADTTADEDESEGPSEAKRSTEETTLSNPNTLRESGGDGSGVTLTQSGSFGIMGTEAGARRAGMALSLTRKKVTFLLMNLVGFHAKIELLSDRRVVLTHGKILDKILTVVTAAKGICDGFSGDRFLTSFNGVRALGTHRVAACFAAVVLRDAVKDEHSFAVSASVACGEARVGNMGCDVMRKYTFVSPVVSWAYALERYARSVDIDLLADHFVVSDVGSGYVLRTIGQVFYEKRLAAGIPMTLSRVLVQRKAGGNEEWMYVLEEQAAADPQAIWNKFAACVLSKNWAVCNK